MTVLAVLLLLAAPWTVDRVHCAAAPVRDLAAAGDRLWAATAGGVAEACPDTGAVRLHTCLDGLPSQDVLRVTAEETGLTAIGRTWAARWDGTRWSPGPVPAPPDPLWTAASGGRTLGARRSGMLEQGPTGWQPLPVRWPPGATHPVGLIADPGGGFLIGFHGAGVARLRDERLTLLPGTPADVAALAGGASPWCGTRGGHLQELLGPRRIALPAGPPGNAVMALAWWRDRLWAGTFDHGLAAWDGRRWSPAPAGSSSPWIKQLVVFDDRLWVRHAEGVLESFDGRSWRRWGPADGLKRSWCSAVAASADSLWAGVWGGLARYRAGRWTLHTSPSPLSGEIITTVAVGGGRVAAGTQRRGLLIGSPLSGRWEVIDEADGLADPWVTSLVADGPGFLVATFQGGTYRWSPEAGLARLEAVPAQAGPCCLLPGEEPLCGSREGLYDAAGRLAVPLPDPEINALLRVGGTVWVATRAGLAELRRAEESALPASNPPP